MTNESIIDNEYGINTQYKYNLLLNPNIKTAQNCQMKEPPNKSIGNKIDCKYFEHSTYDNSIDEEIKQSEPYNSESSNMNLASLITDRKHKEQNACQISERTSITEPSSYKSAKSAIYLNILLSLAQKRMRL